MGFHTETVPRRFRITTMKGVSMKGKNMVTGFRLMKMEADMRATSG